MDNLFFAIFNPPILIYLFAFLKNVETCHLLSKKQNNSAKYLHYYFAFVYYLLS
jgi:hypothetical protein